MSVLEQYIGLVVVLFILSLICERLADFLKHYLSEANTPGLGKRLKDFFGIGDLVRKGRKDSLTEDKRYYRILKINIYCGFFTAWSMHANLFEILQNKKEPFNVIGWNDVIWHLDPREWSGEMVVDGFVFIMGCFATGFFISFGSKFWHDLLDLLYEAKNYRRLLTDPNTYRVDNIHSFDKLLATYESDFIKAAYLEAQPIYMAMPSVSAFSLMLDDLGYYFNLKLKRPDPGIGSYYQYLLNGEIPQNIRIKITLMRDDVITAHTLDLSGKIFNTDQSGKWGTLGCLVRPLEEQATERYILTCCHNVIVPVSKVNEFQPGVVSVGTSGAGVSPVGKVVQACRDHEIDAALIQVNEGLFGKITNKVPQMGTPGKSRLLKSKDENNVSAYLYGAASQGKNQEGVVTSVYSSAEINYSGEKYQLTNLIVISNNGKAVSKKGDSGSVVLDEDNAVIGLVIAGDSKDTYVVPIEKILTKFHVQLL